MNRKISYVTDEEWKILEQKINIFKEHIASFHKEVEKKLIYNQIDDPLIDKTV